ncbi:hypothetical protein ACEOSJ_004953 [Klebsiella pneumoniae]
MSTYKTGNPLGSAAVKDLFDNAENLDFALNSLTALIWTDRLGKVRPSFFGMETSFLSQMASQESRFTSQLADQDTRFDTFIASSGYDIVGDYTVGTIPEGNPLTITEYNQLIRYNNELYKLTAATNIPFTASGKTDETWTTTDSAHFVSVGDAALRQNLSSGEPGMGADMLAFRNALGHASTIGDYLREAYIRVHSRYELLQAIEHINNEIQHPTEIRLARNFASWNDAKTDIDITYASIVGEGGNVVIDAQGIPDAAGNYFMRIFNSKKSDINNLANIYC